MPHLHHVTRTVDDISSHRKLYTQSDRFNHVFQTTNDPRAVRKEGENVSMNSGVIHKNHVKIEVDLIDNGYKMS